MFFHLFLGFICCFFFLFFLFFFFRFKCLFKWIGSKAQVERAKYGSNIYKIKQILWLLTNLSSSIQHQSCWNTVLRESWPGKSWTNLKVGSNFNFPQKKKFPNGLVKVFMALYQLSHGQLSPVQLSAANFYLSNFPAILIRYTYKWNIMGNIKNIFPFINLPF